MHPNGPNPQAQAHTIIHMHKDNTDVCPSYPDHPDTFLFSFLCHECCSLYPRFHQFKPMLQYQIYL